MRFWFNQRKAAQVAAHLLKLHGGKMKYLKLIKLMYLAERRVLVERGRLITGDNFVSMAKGPVVSKTYDCIVEGGAPARAWLEYISEPSSYDVRLRAPEPDDSELSDYEIRILGEVHQQYGAIDRFELCEMTHTLPEWFDPERSSREIRPEDILRAEGWSEPDIREAVEQSEDLFSIDRVADSARTA